jgi:hypothetical protein
MIVLQNKTTKIKSDFPTDLASKISKQIRSQTHRQFVQARQVIQSTIRLQCDQNGIWPLFKWKIQ